VAKIIWSLRVYLKIYEDIEVKNDIGGSSRRMYICNNVDILKLSAISAKNISGVERHDRLVEVKTISK
jgi:hypothetical protein